MIYYVESIDCVNGELFAKGPQKAYRSMFKLDKIPLKLNVGDFFEYKNNEFSLYATQQQMRFS